MNPKIETDSHLLQKAAFGLSVLCDLLLANICLNYYFILHPVGIMNSRVDSRGGFWEMQMMVPFLAIVAGAAGVVAARSNPLQRWGFGSASLSLSLWLTLLILIHFIRTSLS